MVEAFKLELALAAVRQGLLAQALNGAMAEGTANRYLRSFEAFTNYAATRQEHPQDVSPATCAGYIQAANARDECITASTSRLRLAALRSAYRSLVEAGFCSDDPTRDLRVERQVGAAVICPLIPPEVRRLETSSRLGTADTLRPAVVAAALAGASHTEVAALVMADFDVADSSLLISRATPRQRRVQLDGTSLAAMRARVFAFSRSRHEPGRDRDPSAVPLAMHRSVAEYRPGSVAPTVSMNLSRALARGGIHRVGVRPRSLREYAANRVYAQTGRVEDVARTLGLVSLDATFRLVDTQWQQRWGEVIRSAGPR